LNFSFLKRPVLSFDDAKLGTFFTRKQNGNQNPQGLKPFETY